MRLVAYLAAAATVAAVSGGGVQAAAEDLDEARAQAWFWADPLIYSPAPSSSPRDHPRSRTSRGETWFWSFKADDERPARSERQPGRSPRQSVYDEHWFWSFGADDPDESASAGQAEGRSERHAARDEDWFWSFEAVKREPPPAHAISFSGTDLWREGAFLYGGMMWAPAGVDNDGLVLKLIATRGIYRYRSGLLGDASVRGMMYAGSVLPGLHFTRGPASVSVYAGYDVQFHYLWPNDPGSRTRGLHRGIRIAGDLWLQATPTMMIAAAATLSTIDSSYAVRLACGWLLFQSFYLGPEFLAYGAQNYRQLRAGVHISGLKLLSMEWQAGVGYAGDDDGNRGFYARLAVSEKW